MKLQETWIDAEELAYVTPTGSVYGSRRKGLVRMDNGTLRKVTLGIPDTYFTIPALTSAGIKGYVDVDDNGDFHFHASRKHE